MVVSVKKAQSYPLLESLQIGNLSKEEDQTANALPSMHTLIAGDA